jgi:hypothetical protein
MGGNVMLRSVSCHEASPASQKLPSLVPTHREGDSKLVLAKTLAEFQGFLKIEGFLTRITPVCE